MDLLGLKERRTASADLTASLGHAAYRVGRAAEMGLHALALVAAVACLALLLAAVAVTRGE